MEKEKVVSKLLKHSWGGRTGIKQYFIGILDASEALHYVMQNYEYRPQCGDRVKIEEMVGKGTVFAIERETFDGRFGGFEEWETPCGGFVVTIHKCSCD